MKPTKSKTISVRIPAALYERIESLVEARLSAGHDEETFSIIVRKLLKLGLIELETR